MKIFNFGSLNIDHVYRVPHFVQPGETLLSSDYQVFAGGKGANQSVALARAGAPVIHAGKIGSDGRWLKEYLSKAGADASLVLEGEIATGHAIIQVDPSGRNSIILYGGANQAITDSEVKTALTSARTDDIVLLQNELNATQVIIDQAHAQGLSIAFNPAPMTAEVRKLPLEKISYLIVNEIEGAELAGQGNPSQILAELTKMLPNTEVVLTLGEQGLLYGHGSHVIQIPAEKVSAVDTTAAGDTFIGYFLAEISRGSDVELALRLANKAAAICVTRKGAAESIPLRAEVILSS